MQLLTFHQQCIRVSFPPHSPALNICRIFDDGNSDQCEHYHIDPLSITMFQILSAPVSCLLHCFSLSYWIKKINKILICALISKYFLIHKMIKVVFNVASSIFMTFLYLKFYSRRFTFPLKNGSTLIFTHFSKSHSDKVGGKNIITKPKPAKSSGDENSKTSTCDIAK